MKPGEAPGLIPGKARTFRAAAAVREPSGELLSEYEIGRYEAEEFVEEASERLHVLKEPVAKGFSRVLEFSSADGAQAEMAAELREWRTVGAPHGVGRRYLTLRRITFPRVSPAGGYAFVTNSAATALGIELGIAQGVFVAGNCLFAVGIYRPDSSEVSGPIVAAVNAISERIGGACSGGPLT